MKSLKQQIAQTFGNKAADYDRHARMQKYAGSQLIKDLVQCVSNDADQRLSPTQKILDLGTGSGFFLPELKRHFAADLYALDLSEGMCRYVTKTHKQAIQGVVAADAEQLPFADDVFSMVYSSMAIQWCQDLPRLFSELSRVVEPGGYIALTTLLPNTLFELEASWGDVDQVQHVNRFFAADDVLVAAQAEAKILQARSERVCLEYPDVKSILNSIKGIGANRVTSGSKPMSKKSYKQLLSNYERYRSVSGGLPASYEVLYLILKV